MSSLVEPFYTAGKSVDDVYNDIEWERRDAVIKKYGSSEVVFEQRDIEVPKSWSDQALQIVAQKYFKGPIDDPRRETSIKHLVNRVVNRVVGWGVAGAYFSAEEAESYAAELTYLLVNQYAAFNSPVWFNVGTEFSTNPDRPQCSACFINSVEDEMEGEHGILSVVVREGKIFKDGSGSGINLWKLRSSKEDLSGGGKPSGPVSFMRTFDVNAGQIKSGGKTRRAAKMVILNVDHGDVLEFIECKAKEEKRAQELIGLGYDSSFDNANGAYGLVFFQNANHSVRVSDEFMEAACSDGAFSTRKRVRNTKESFGVGEELETLKAKHILRKMAEAAWSCGDPGIQYHDTVNKWNPVLDTITIHGSNPCSEYMFIDDSACNLASMNLMKFVQGQVFNHEAFRAASRTMILAMEILVENSGYPTKSIATNSHDYRPLGLGYANLGSLLMTSGVPYDSDKGRGIAAAVTSLMGAAAYEMSANIAGKLGPFAYWTQNESSFLQVLEQHRDASRKVGKSKLGDVKQLALFASTVWTEAIKGARKHGVRNAQVTVLAPTGTIGFMMDCQTTGIEPELALVKYKTLVGGGTMKLVNNEVNTALTRLGYEETQRNAIVKHIEEKGTAEGAPGLEDEHLTIFDTSFPAFGYTRTIAPMGHVRMMAAVQPFLSGAISKTVNMPEEATVEDIESVYIEGWKLGLKAIAIYRNNCKKSQPLATKASEGVATGAKQALRSMSNDRSAIIHEFKIGGQKVFLTVGLFDDGSPCEIFIDTAKEGSTVSGLLDAFSIQTSMALQHGVPLGKMVDKFSHMSFEPSGITSSKKIRFAKSIIDYIFRFLGEKFLKDDVEADSASLRAVETTSDAPPCGECGSIMTRNGSCYKCPNCGSTSGCS